ncbi:MAG: tetratricopeptide repeat protein [Candidatus Bathyarchaeia archaeon]|jgi:TolB-like protein/class 3 adenylate cyclase/Flp pilus assembly protein TadD
MSDHTEQRKLAAIMFTDMVGYSALAQRNEKLALELLAEQQLLLRTQFPLFDGREVKTTGDGFLVEFPSALQATQCAVEIQRGLVARNATQPIERHIHVRIGIHVGDVVHREADMYGDGVNIAARIEPLAIGGGICLSDAVYGQVRNKLGVQMTKLDSPELKNIELPIEVYRVVLPWQQQAPVVATSRAALPSKPSARMLAVGLVATVVLVAAGWWFVHQSGKATKQVASSPSASTSPAASSAAPAADQKSIAVLPFVNMSADKDNEYLSDGITEDLCTALTQVRGLRVPARTSCFVFKGKTDDIQKIGQQLHVATVLEGSVSQSGNKLRITAQLISVADGFHLWATNYDREMSDLLALRSEIAQQVVAAMRVQLLPGEKQQLEKKGTENPEAHRLYLLGRSFWNQRTGEAVKKALDYFEQALVKDPNYALAHVGLADCYILLPEYANVPNKEAIPKARAAALTALKLDDTLGEAHAALGMVRENEWDWQGAEAELRQAIELTPNYATAHHWYSILLRGLGRFDEANREIQRAQELDPLSPIINVNVGWVQYFQGHYDQAIAVFRTVLELNPQFSWAHFGLGAAYLMKQMHREAIMEFQTIRASVGNTPSGLAELGCAYGISGRVNEARKVLDELTGFLQQGYEVQSDIAQVYHGLGNREKTLDWLEKALEAQGRWTLELKVNPLWQDLRSEPRFLALLKNVGLEK